MKLYQNTINGIRYRGWTRSETITYFIKGVARELKIFPSFFQSIYDHLAIKALKKKWLKESCFDFNGIKLPDISNSNEKLRTLKLVFDDVFLFPCLYSDNYDKNLVNYLDRFMAEGPYGYTDGTFDVTVKAGDVVIDAGAWIGDFSAYAASKGATAYAFEPVEETFQWLCKTKELNNANNGGQIYPVRKGLGSSECEMSIVHDNENSGANTISTISGKRNKSMTEEKITITTLDQFVEENHIEKVDFIKADIEGAERDMLRGATHVLKTFAPRLAICTYHLVDDPKVLEQIIKEANPAYTVVHLRHKLFAAVVSHFRK
jgi:FkbM family methyltransferase